MDNVFVDAAACGDLKGIEALLADASTTAAQVNRLDKDGRSAFHYSCLNDDLPLLRVLLGDGRVDVELRSPKGDTCMHLASLYACLEVLKVLFQNPRTAQLLDAQNQFGETPLHLCAGSGDKGAVRAAELLLHANAKLTLVDKWERDPLSVAKDNGENALVDVFQRFLSTQPAEVQTAVARLGAHYLANVKFNKPEINSEQKANQAKSIFAGLGAVGQLKKVVVQEKTMFAQSEGKVGGAAQGKDAANTSGRRILSKLVDFPGDVAEITALVNGGQVDLGGQDAYGLTALAKFASWNKTELMDLLLPKLSRQEVNFQDREGKTALHWAVEMAAVGAVSRLVESDLVDPSLADAKGRTPLMILDQAPESGIITRLRNALLKL